MTHSIRWLTVTVALIAGAQVVSAQIVTCVDPATHATRESCQFLIDGGNARVGIRVTTADGSPIANAVVVFAGGPKAWLSDTVRTDAAGVAIGSWTGAPVPTTITATVHADARRYPLNITVAPAVPKHTIARSARGLDGASGQGLINGTVWYEGRHIGPQPTVEIAVNSPGECSAAKVAFKASFDGAVSADTVRGEYLNGVCISGVRWKLGTALGNQDLRATLASDPTQQVRYTTYARKLPYLSAGLFFGWLPEIDVTKTHSRTITQTVAEKRGDTTYTTATPVTRDSIEVIKNGGTFGFRPTFGFNTPILLRWTGIRASVSVDAQNIRDGAFVGLSLLPLTSRTTNYEDLGIDVHAVLFLDTRERLATPDSCVPTGIGCETTRGLRVNSAGIVGQVNTTSLLSTLTGLFPE